MSADDLHRVLGQEVLRAAVRRRRAREAVERARVVAEARRGEQNAHWPPPDDGTDPDTPAATLFNPTATAVDRDAGAAHPDAGRV